MSMAEQGRQEQGKTQPRTQEQRIADLELQLATTKAGLPLGNIPDHAAGVGQEIEETWSQYDQELAAKGEHPFQEPDPEEPPPVRKT
jgi:hypothetical protein